MNKKLIYLVVLLIIISCSDKRTKIDSDNCVTVGDLKVENDNIIKKYNASNFILVDKNKQRDIVEKTISKLMTYNFNFSKNQLSKIEDNIFQFLLEGDLTENTSIVFKKNITPYDVEEIYMTFSLHENKNSTKLELDKNICKTFSNNNKPYVFDFNQRNLNLVTNIQKSRFRYTSVDKFEELINVSQEQKKFNDTKEIIEIYDKKETKYITKGTDKNGYEMIIVNYSTF